VNAVYVVVVELTVTICVTVCVSVVVTDHTKNVVVVVARTVEVASDVVAKVDVSLT